MKRFLYCFFAMLLCAFCFSACKQEEPVDSSSTSEVKESSAIAFVQNEITLAIGDSVQAEIETSKKNVFVFWSIRDENLATVSNDGVITDLTERGKTLTDIVIPNNISLSTNDISNCFNNIFTTMTTEFI